MEFEKYFCPVTGLIAIHRARDRVVGPGKIALHSNSWDSACDLFVLLMQTKATVHHWMHDRHAEACALSIIGGWVSVYKRDGAGMVVLSSEKPDLCDCASLGTDDDPTFNIHDLLGAKPVADEEGRT